MEHPEDYDYHISHITYCTLRNNTTEESGFNKDMNFHSCQLLYHHKEIFSIREIRVANLIVFSRNWKVGIIFSPSKMQITCWIYVHFPAGTEKQSSCLEPSLELAEVTSRKAPSETDPGIPGSFRLTCQYVQLRWQLNPGMTRLHNSCMGLSGPFWVISAYPPVVDALLEALNVSFTILHFPPKEWAF